MKGFRRGSHPLNSTSLALYAVIERIHSLTGIGPTYKQMMQETGLKSNSAVQYHLGRLADFGYIKRGEHRQQGGITPIHYPRIYYRPESERPKRKGKSNE